MSIDWGDLNTAIKNLSPKVIILKRDAFCLMCEFETLCHFDAAAINLKDSAMKLQLGVQQREYVMYFLDQVHERKDFLHGM